MSIEDIKYYKDLYEHALLHGAEWKNQFQMLMSEQVELLIWCAHLQKKLKQYEENEQRNN